MSLPDFPVDEQSLALLDQALDPWAHGDPTAVSSSLESYLEMMSRLGGAGDAAADEQGVTVLAGRQYSADDLIKALVAEVRRLRAAS